MGDKHGRQWFHFQLFITVVTSYQAARSPGHREKMTLRKSATLKGLEMNLIAPSAKAVSFSPFK